MEAAPQGHRDSAKRNVVAIIDDEPSTLKALERLLTAFGFTTEIFTSGEAFLHRSDARDVTCIVADIQMAGISGIEMRRQLKAMGSTAPVIFMTALDSSVVRSEAMEAGYAAILQKPFPGHALIDSIRGATAHTH